MLVENYSDRRFSAGSPQTTAGPQILGLSLSLSRSVSNYIYIYRVSQEEGTKLREGVSYVKLYRKTPQHLYPKLNGLGDNGN
jgi:hypothetical protein